MWKTTRLSIIESEWRNKQRMYFVDDLCVYAVASSTCQYEQPLQEPACRTHTREIPVCACISTGVQANIIPKCAAPVNDAIAETDNNIEQDLKD